MSRDKVKEYPTTAVDLHVERAKYLVEQLKQTIPYLEELTGLSSEIRQNVEQQITEYALSLRSTKLKPEELEEFFSHPYVLQPVERREDTWRLIIPKFVDVQFGWLEKQTPGYNIFLVNRYMDWLGELPEEIKKQLGFKTPPNLELDGEYLRGPRMDIDRAQERYRGLIRGRDEKGLVINKRRTFELIAALIKDGVLPFKPQPVPQEDLVKGRRFDFELRDYQREAWKVFLKYSNTGIFYPASVGKTVIGLYAMTRLKPPHLVVVPTRILVEQWLERIQAHTDLQPSEYVVCTYHTALKKYGKQQWSLMIVDETHHIPSDHFSGLSLIPRKYTMGLTASPQREDKREEYIFALTGRPVGLGWDHFKQLGLIKSPVAHVWILKNFEMKIRKISHLLAEEKKTLIFSDSLETGRTISKRFDVPFVSGETGNGRLDIISENPVAVVSRVADEGVSLPSIQRIIEVSWLYGSRRQELQRFTRLLHSQISGEVDHHILMTLDEYLHDRKRLFSIMDKGFKIEIHREGIREDKIVGVPSRPVRRYPIRRIGKEPTEASTPTPTMAPSTGAVHDILNLPGVQKNLQRLPKKAQKFWEFLLKNDGTWYKRSALVLLLGYTSVDSMRHSIDFNDMERRGLIESQRIEGELAYRTNMRVKVG